MVLLVADHYPAHPVEVDRCLLRLVVVVHCLTHLAEVGYYLIHLVEGYPTQNGVFQW